jgi:uncharacterized RDD family membrane protein YckC
MISLAPGGAVRAGFVSRSVAFVLDLILISLISGIINDVLAGVWDVFGLGAFKLGRYLLVGSVIWVTVLLSLCWFPLAWHLVGCSPGKAIVGLRVVAVDGRPLGLMQALLRFGGYWISGIPLFLGFLWSLFDDRGQAWHDRLARTTVVRAASRTPLVVRGGVNRTTGPR